MTNDDGRTDIDAIADALARIRGPRRRGGPWGHPSSPPSSEAPPFGDDRARHARHGEHGEHARGRGHGGPGGPGWGGPGRMGGIARLRMLEALAAASHPLSVSEIGEAIGVDQPRASRLIQQAVDLGLVRREADPDDARRTRIALTEAGAYLAQGVRGERRAKVGAALDGFSEVERAELARLLGKLADAWPSG